MIVISKHRKDAMLRFESTNQLCAGRRVSALLGNVITGERDQIWFEIVGDFDCALKMPRIDQRAIMKIGKVNYARSVQRFRQTAQVNLLAFDRRHKWLSQGEAGHFTER